MKAVFHVSSALIFISTIAATSMALESYYVVNPMTPKGVVELEYSRAQTSTSRDAGIWRKLNSSENDNIFKLNYARRWRDWTFSGGTSFQTRDISSDYSNENGTVTGFGDFAFAAKSGIVLESVTLTYGGLLNLSPGPAQYAYTPERNPRSWDDDNGEKTSGNNFSGIQSASPFVGVESYVDEIAVGGRLLANFYSDQKVEGGKNPYAKESSAARSFRLEAFTEIPVYNRLDVGLVAGFGRKDAPGNFFEGGNEYLAQIYSQVRIDKEMAATIAWTSSTQKVPVEKSSNEVSIGFRRSM